MIETVSSAGMTMKYFRFGNENTKPLVIIPGVSLKSVLLSAQIIAAQYNIFNEDRNVYVLDRREGMPEEYSVYDMAEDTAEAIDILSLKNVEIYGVSQGGMIAQIMAVKRPDLVSKLILCSTTPYVPAVSREVMSKWIEYAENKDMTSLMESFADNIYTKEYCEKYRDAFAKFGESVTDEDLHRFIISVRGCEGFDITKQLDSIKCPVLVIGADKDKIFGEVPSRVIAEHTNSELYIYSDQAHGVYDENEDVLIRIKKFLIDK